MEILGWIAAIWLIGSIIYSTILALNLSQSPITPDGYLGRMLFMQLIKGVIAYFILNALI